MQNPNFPLRARPKDSTDKVCSNESLSSWHLECQNLIETTNSEANFSIFWHKISVLFFGWRPPMLLAARNVLPIKVAKKRSIQQCTHLGQNSKSFWFYVKAFIKSSQWNEFIWNNKTDANSLRKLSPSLWTLWFSKMYFFSVSEVMKKGKENGKKIKIVPESVSKDSVHSFYKDSKYKVDSYGPSFLAHFLVL